MSKEPSVITKVLILLKVLVLSASHATGPVLTITAHDLKIEKNGFKCLCDTINSQ